MSVEIRAVTEESVGQAAVIIRQGGVVAFPTETYYGLAVDPFNEKALSLLFAAKERPLGKPILTLIGAQAQLRLLAQEIPNVFQPLMTRFWPGPLTLIFSARPELPALLTGASGTIGVRISSHPHARMLLQVLRAPVTATSANLSGQPPAETAAAVAHQFGCRLDLILDGGKTAGPKPSTLIGRRGEHLVLLRPGLIPAAEIRTALPGIPLIE